jgi:glycosyltransferase involved in cell wall biosynthesis
MIKLNLERGTPSSSHLSCESMIPKSSVLLIGPTPPPFHGVAVAIQTLLQSCIVEKFRVCHLDLADRRGIQHVNKPDLHDVALFLRQWLRLVGMLFCACPTLTYLVLSQSTIGFLRDSLLIWPASLRGSHIVLHLHGGNFRDWFLGRSWFMKAYVRTVLGRVTRVIVLGDSLKSQFDGLVDNRRIAVVPNGIDWQDSGTHARVARSSSRYRVLHLCTLSHLKGALVLIEAIPLVVRHRQDVEFVFAGLWSHAEDKQWADQFIVQQGIGQYIRFTGQVEGAQKRALFESSDIFVFPGVQQEGQPLVVIEAMAAGLPVIFTDRGCLRDTVIDGETGLEAPINDPCQLADRILWLQDHPGEMRAMGQAGRNRYEAFFTKDKHIAAMTHMFESAVA